MAKSSDIQDFLIDCTTRVETPGQVGTGFFIAPGLVLTCAHLIEDAENGDYPLSDVDIHWGGERHPARVVRYAASPSPNLAVLETELKQHPCAYLFESLRPDDTLYVCGFSSEENGDAVRLLIEGSEANGSTLKLGSVTADAALSGAPVLNLRTGGVCAILNTATEFGAESASRAIPASILVDLFPEIQTIHNRNHEETPRWFDCTGIVGTVFAARSHLTAMRANAEEPIQPVLAPKSQASAMDLLSPTTFRALSSESDVGRTVSIEEFLDRNRKSHRSLLVVGQAGSGRSSLLRLFGFKAAASCRNLGARNQDCLFPILLRANQLTSGEGSVEELILNAVRNSKGRIAQTSLPSSFLTDLAELPGLRLLIMVDGVDEIQNARDLGDLVDLIGRIQADPGFGSRTQLILTSRPTSAEHFRYSDLDVYELLPLDLESVEQTAQKWARRRFEGFSGAKRRFARFRPPVLAPRSVGSPWLCTKGMAADFRGRSSRSSLIWFRSASTVGRSEIWSKNTGLKSWTMQWTCWDFSRSNLFARQHSWTVTGWWGLQQDISGPNMISMRPRPRKRPNVSVSLQKETVYSWAVRENVITGPTVLFEIILRHRTW